MSADVRDEVSSVARRLLVLGCLTSVLSACGPTGDVGPVETQSDKVIYGTDDRQEASSGSSAEKAAARAVATVFSSSGELSCGSSTCDLYSVPYNDWFSPPLCSDEPFRTQNTLGFCTAFLVGPNLIASAGHCVTSQHECDDTAYFFGFEQPAANGLPLSVSKNDVYYCKSIVARVETSTDDWEVIEVDRDVQGVTPLCIRRSGSPAMGAGLTVIGHPYDLPKKIADNAIVQSVNSKFFTANLDVYGGNSGSPVFETGAQTVSGILVRGNGDYEISNGCTQSVVCPNTGCDGTFEEVSHASRMANYVPVVSCLGEECAELDCDDGNACTMDSCGQDGCSHVNAANGSGCPGGSCKNGTCVAKCDTFTGTVSRTAKSSVQNLGKQSNAVLSGKLTCLPGVNTNLSLYLERKSGANWINVAKSTRPGCSEHLRYTVGPSTFNGATFRWRVAYTADPGARYTLEACGQE